MPSRAGAYRSPTYHELPATEELDWRPFRPEGWRAYREEWARRGREGDPGGFPLHLDVDPTNRCNLSCVMCPRTVYIRRGSWDWAPGGFRDMEIPLYRRLIDEGAEKGLQSVKLNFLGEPLLHPQIAEMVSIASQKGLWVMLNTNAVLLSGDLSERLIAAGLTDIFFSFDSPYEAEYERVRRGASYAKTLANIRGFMAALRASGRRHVQTRASMVLPESPEGREKIKRDYTQLFRGLGVAEIGFGLPTVVDRDYSKLPAPEGFVCPDLFRRVFVFSDGAAGPCCGDWERRLIVGSAGPGGSALSEIWRSEAYRGLRERHLSGQYKAVPACRACSVPHLSGVEA
jgi:uncharacterized Fe-S cluster-containing radical SAM superfamily protein